MIAFFFFKSGSHFVMGSRITFITIDTRPIEQHLCEIIFNLCQKFRYSLFISQLLPMLAILRF